MTRRGRPAGAASIQGVLSAIVASALIGAMSSVSWKPARADRAALRLSWRAAGAAVETCRTPTEEENARLPAHMRRPQICERRSSPFLLQASLDGVTVRHDTLEAAAARDQPLYVLDRVEIAPGIHDVEVIFEALLPELASNPTGFPPRLRLMTRIEIAAGETVLITYDPSTRSLVARP